MATPASLKDLSKAINTFIQSPRIPLPDELNEVITAYLEKHDRNDEPSSERLNNELISIYQKCVVNRPDKYAAFLALLRPLRPAIRTSARLVQWWDRLIEPILEYMSQERGLAKEALANVLDLVSFEEEGSAGSDSHGPNVFADRLLRRWMQVLEMAELGDNPSTEFNERVIREGITRFGKKDPKSFMTALDGFFVQKEYRNRSLHLLCHFIQSEPPHLHTVLETPLFGNILQSLQHDDSTTTVSLALANLILLLPNMPSSLIPFLPTLFNVYARLLFWDRDRSFAKEHAAWEVESPGAEGPGMAWEKCFFDNDLDGNSIPYLSDYFTILYGLYPINFVDYIRKPQRYLRHANNEDDIDVQATEIRDRSEQFRRRHLLHPNFYSLTIESEKSDLSRWIKSEAAEVAVECMALCIDGDETGAGLQGVAAMPESVSALLNEATDADGVDRPLLRRSIGQASSSGDSQSSHLRPTPSAAESLASGGSGVVRRSSQSSHLSTGESAENRQREIGNDSPTLPAHLVSSSSHTQLQDMIHSNKVIKSGLHQSHANDSVPSLSLAHQEPFMERGFLQLQPLTQPATLPTSHEMSANVARLHRQNLLLQIDLDFERYMKQQHMGYVGELRRKQLREAATEAEAQNLIMVNRSMKHRLEEAKRAELQVKKESDIRRNMGKRLEADLTSKLRALREEQKQRRAEEAALKHDLEDAQGECQRLRKLITDAEEATLKSKQDSEAMDISAEEIAKLRAEITRLSAAERRYQGKEVEMQTAIQEAADAEAKAEMQSMRLAAHENELAKVMESYESRILTLNKQRTEAIEDNQERRDNNVSAVLESALAASRAKQAEMQKQFGLLMKKYTALQSAFATAQREVEEEKTTAPSPDPHADTSPVTGASLPVRTKTQRGFSDPKAFDTASYNATPPLEPMSTSLGSEFMMRPSTPPSAGPSDPPPAARTSPQAERYHGRGGVQNTIRKERKDSVKKEEKPEKKDKKTGGLRGIRGFV